MKIVIRCLIACAAVFALSATVASAATITSTGPLEGVTVGNLLSCQIDAGDFAGEWYSSGACGTFLAVPGTSPVVHGPPSLPAGPTNLTPFTAVSQTGPTGTGGVSDPYTITTVVDATPNPGIRVTQTDTYVTGQDSYNTTVQIANNGSQTASGLILYHGGDCYLGNSDSGYGAHDANTGAISCTKTANNTPAGAALTLTPVANGSAAGSNFSESGYSTNWSRITSGSPLPNLCDCAINEDNGESLSWSLAPLAAGGTDTVSFRTTVTPGPPTAITNPATLNSETTATLNGQVAPNGRATTFWFEWGTTASQAYGSETTHTSASGTGYALQSVASGIGGLTPGTQYHYRMVASNTLGTVRGQEVTFTTPQPSAPNVVTEFGEPTGDNTASVFGSVTPNGLPTIYYFEYGPTTAYGSETLSQDAGSGYSSNGYSADLTGLTPGTLYHYRIVAANNLGTTLGLDDTFTTTGTAPVNSGGSNNNTNPITTPITTPVVTPTGNELTPPVQGQTANVTPEKGEVFVKLPGAAKSSVPRFKGAPKGFIPLTQARQVPIGSILDTTSGQVGLTVAASKTTTQQASFSQGRFGFAQSKSGSPLTTLTMQGGNLTQCGTKVPSGGAKKVSAAARRGRSLFGSGHGRFRTRGRNSSATVRGTEWLTKDTCAGTLTVVRRGTVVVRDFTKRKNVVVKKGHRYFARAPKKH